MQTPLTDVNYRGDIDGLRAIAVLSVVLCHAGMPHASGGFVGVDVFFVISGFLISRILLTDIGQKRFSILRFYDRRIRRIMPAFGLMAFGTSLAAVAILTPLELEKFGQSLIAAATFCSNLWFWRGTNYFAAPSHTLILLHTWSLAVEEQFYIVWPVVLWVLSRRHGGAYLPLVASGAIVCLIVSQYAAVHSPAAAFYLLPSRAWELALGALVASPSVQQFRSAHVREVACATGLLLILYAVVAYDATTPFPGVHALAPSLGATLLIHSGAGTRIGKLLAIGPFRSVGLVSYSLYLWHWPALCLSRQYVGRSLDSVETVAALGICGALSILSWYYVEQPFRHRRPPADFPKSFPWRSVQLAAALIGLLVGAGGVLAATRGLPARGPSSAVAAEAAARESHDSSAYCTQYDLQTAAMVACRSAPTPPRVALWGDSHAGHLATVLAARMRKTGASLLSLIGCSPTPGASPVTGVPASDRICKQESVQALSRIHGYPTISMVVLAGRWSRYTETYPSPGEEGLPIYLADDTNEELSASNSRRVLRESLDRAISTLRSLGIDILIVGQVPEFGIDTTRCVAHALWRGISQTHCFAPVTRVRARLQNSNVILRDLVAAHPGVGLVDPLPFFCDNVLCRSVKGGKMLYADDDHLSHAGADYLLHQSGILDRLDALTGGHREAVFDATLTAPSIY